jgi:hypothetical protein
MLKKDTWQQNHHHHHHQFLTRKLVEIVEEEKDKNDRKWYKSGMTVADHAKLSAFCDDPCCILT